MSVPQSSKSTKAIGGVAIGALVLAGAAVFGGYRSVSTSNGPSLTPTPSIYHPDRLQRVQESVTVSGTVLAVLHEMDGDYHLWVYPTSAIDLPGRNQYHGKRALVAEITPQCDSQPSNAWAARACPTNVILPPKVGDSVTLTGPYVFDRNHQWFEIHPVEGLSDASM